MTQTMNREYFLNNAGELGFWNAVSAYIHTVNVEKGFWPKDVRTRNVGEALALIHSEITEAVEAAAEYAMDDKLTQYPGSAVEVGDAIIRVLDLGAAFGADFALDDELLFVEADPYHSFNEDMLHAHGLVSNALEVHRKSSDALPRALSNILSFLLSVMYKYDYSLDIIFDKVAYNVGRPFKHGKAY